MYTEQQMRDIVMRRNEQLEARAKVLEVQYRELEVENQQLRDSIVEMVRRLQEVVTWNELDIPRRREDDDE